MISVIMRIILIVFSIGLLVHVLRSINKAKVQIDDIIFWLLFCAVLIVLAIFPQLASWAAGLLGISSPINLVYLVVIFLMLIKNFKLSVKCSQLEMKLKTLTQELAVKDFIDAEGNSEEGQGPVAK